MNKGTIIRVSAISVAVLAALVCMFDVIAFPFWIKVLIALALVVAAVVCTYFNNDFSEEACRGTGMTRQIKREKKPDYVGERFYTSNGVEIKEVINDESDNL